jgi:transcriptional regulator with XRE-family HTH domain
MILDSEAIGLRLLLIRKELKLTRDAFGSKIGVQGYVIRNIEDNRNKKINEPLLISISSQYGISKEWLLYGTGDKYVKNKESIIDELVNTYNLSYYGKQIIKTYIDLPNDKRAIIDDFVEQLAINVSVDATLVAARGNSNKIVDIKKSDVEEDMKNYVPPDNL